MKKQIKKPKDEVVERKDIEILHPAILEDTNPFHNPNAILIIKQKDGNYKGWMNKFGKVVEVREIGPETVLQKLLTHE
jgi:hypothetical protein